MLHERRIAEIGQKGVDRVLVLNPESSWVYCNALIKGPGLLLEHLRCSKFSNRSPGQMHNSWEQRADKEIRLEAGLNPHPLAHHRGHMPLDQGVPICSAGTVGI